MKKAILFLLLSAVGATAAAQDLIVKRDASRIEARVSEVAPDAVRYKRQSNPDGPTYVLPVSEIEYIRYANGEEDRFAPAAASPSVPAVSSAPAGSATQAAVEAVPVAPTPAARIPAADKLSAQEPPEVPGPQAVSATRPEPAVPVAGAARAADPGVEYVVREYSIGEYYDRNGIRGVICLLSEDKQHGLVLSVDQIYLPWCAMRKEQLQSIGADDRVDGRRNMETVARHIEEQGLRWEDFPAFAWCRGQGDGWYLPAIDELLQIGHHFNGGSRLRSDRDLRMRYNDALKEHGGAKLDRVAYHLSSTEKDAREVHTSHMGIEPPYLVDIPKTTRFVVRAVHRF